MERSQFVRGLDVLGGRHRPHDRSGHGTHIAGVVAQRTDNGRGLAGLAHGAQIMPVRVLDGEGGGDAGDIARGIRYAVQAGADVINLSMVFDRRTRARHPRRDRRARRGAPARRSGRGRRGQRRARPRALPARHPTTIAVGGTTVSGCGTDSSNYGERIDLVAPGGGQDADVENDPTAPHVTAAAALVVASGVLGPAPSPQP